MENLLQKGDRVPADYTGMLGTVMKLCDGRLIAASWCRDTQQTAIAMRKQAWTLAYVDRALRHLEKAASLSLRAGIRLTLLNRYNSSQVQLEMSDAILMAKNGVDESYNADPVIGKTAVKFEES